MALQKRVVTPKIVKPPSDASRMVFILLVVATFAIAIVGAFSIGRQIGAEIAKPLGKHIGTTEDECNALAAEVKRSQQIDRETGQSLSKKLKETQNERLALEKEVSFLRRLIQDGGKGILQPKDLEVEKTGEPGMFRYSFTIRQLIQDFGTSAGRAELQVIGRRNGRETTLSLSELTGSKPLSHKMRFKHFQVFKGSIKVPDDFEPKRLVVKVKPKTAKLIPISEAFPWQY